MTIEQHAEALVKYLKENLVPEGLSESEKHAAVIDIISKHMQSAIDEAMAPLRKRIAELEELGPLIERLRDLVSDGAWEPEMDLSRQIDAILKGSKS